MNKAKHVIQIRRINKKLEKHKLSSLLSILCQCQHQVSAHYLIQQNEDCHVCCFSFPPSAGQCPSTQVEREGGYIHRFQSLSNFCSNSFIMEIGNVISCIHSKPNNIQWTITGSHPNENNMYSIVFYHVFYKYKNYVLISLPVHSGTQTGLIVLHMAASKKLYF